MGSMRGLDQVNKELDAVYQPVDTEYVADNDAYIEVPITPSSQQCEIKLENIQRDSTAGSGQLVIEFRDDTDVVGCMGANSGASFSVITTSVALLAGSTNYKLEISPDIPTTGTNFIDSIIKFDDFSINVSSTGQANSNAFVVLGSGIMASNFSNVTTVRFYFDSGNILSGTITVRPRLAE